MLAATLLLTCGICAEHLIGMAAVTVQPLPSLAVPGAGVGSPWWLALEVAAATCVGMVAALTALTIDTLLSRRVALETQRLQTLANATFEGLLIHSGGAVLDRPAAPHMAYVGAERDPAPAGQEIQRDQRRIPLGRAGRMRPANPGHDYQAPPFQQPTRCLVPALWRCCGEPGP